MNDTLYCGEKLVDLFFYAKRTIKAGIVSYIINNNEQLHMIIYLLGAFLVSLICGLVFTPLILDFCKRKRLYDIPNERKVHKNATPRLGGISFFPSMLTTFFIVLLFTPVVEQDILPVNIWSAVFLAGLLLIYGIGIIVAGMMGALVAFAYFNLFGKAERNTKIFIGDMAFVGPRPERKYYIDQIMARDSRYEQLYMLRPGVTSYATLKNGYTDTIDKMLKRLEMDLYYLEHQSLWMDVKILWKTFVNIVSGKIF